MLDNITQNHHFDKKFISILIEGTIGSCSDTELSCWLIIVTDPSPASLLLHTSSPSALEYREVWTARRSAAYIVDVVLFPTK